MHALNNQFGPGTVRFAATGMPRNSGLKQSICRNSTKLPLEGFSGSIAPMLTDVFENRYTSRKIWNEFGFKEKRLLLQCAHIITKQLFPVWNWEKKLDEKSKLALQSFLDRVGLEVGVKSFHNKYFTNTTNWNGNAVTNTHEWTLDAVYANVFSYELAEGAAADTWMKRCLSIVELAFRQKEAEINAANLRYPKDLASAELLEKTPRNPRSLRIPGLGVDGVRGANASLNAWFKANVDELNTRFEQAITPLSYHNGFIQIKTDQIISDQIEKPFWSLVSAPEWSNVDTDMKHALDLRDTGVRDAAFYAARALESTIKIISGKMSRTVGNEKGAANYIDNLIRESGGRFVEVWEGEKLKSFFAKVRNPLTHGPGDEQILQLTPQQTDWAIEYCMSWIKSLIKRLPT